MYNNKSTRLTKRVPKISPPQLIIVTFLVAIFIGAIILNLPISSNDGKSVGFVNALFTSTSAFCVTGLVVKTTFLQWTVFGKIVILLLVQIGGLGIITLFMWMLTFVGRKITLKDRMVIQHSLNQDNAQGMVKLIKRAVMGTLIIEAVGAFFFAIKFIPLFGIKKGLFYSIFNAVCALCNAGFDIMDVNSLAPYVSSLLVNIPFMLLIILGGLGFTVWADIVKQIKASIKTRQSFFKCAKKFMLHTKIVLVFTFALIIIGAVFYFIVEYSNDRSYGNLNLGTKLLAALFQSVTTRTAGYYTVDFVNLNYPSQFMTIILMFIGGSPAGTAGGIKTVTLGITLISIISIMKGKDTLQAFERNIPFSVLQRTLAVFFICLSIVIVGTMFLSLTEGFEFNSRGFFDALFEITSAMSTCGLSLGLTPNLTDAGKMVVAVSMFLGHLGPVTLIAAIRIKQIKSAGTLNYPEEKIIVG